MLQFKTAERMLNVEQQRKFHNIKRVKVCYIIKQRIGYYNIKHPNGCYSLKQRNVC